MGELLHFFQDTMPSEQRRDGGKEKTVGPVPSTVDHRGRDAIKRGGMTPR